MKTENITWIIATAFIILAIFFAFYTTQRSMHHDMNMDEQREHFIEHKDHMIGELISQGEYSCCLEKPCTYCIEKTSEHGKGATCNCLKDVVEGVHPCGECIGEIMEGHGNPYLSEYFAKAIAEKVGENHIDALRLMIEDLYGMPVEEQA